jgi:predicted PurR-regulated permease PerM
LFLLRQAFVVVFIAYLIASSLYPGIRWLEHRKHLPKGISILSFYCLFLVMAFFIIFLTADLLVEHGSHFVNALPYYVNQVLDFSDHIFPTFRVQERILSLVSTNVQMIITRVYQFLMSTINYVFLVVQGFTALISILALGFFMRLETKEIEATLLRLVPVEYRSKTVDLLRRVSCSVGTYIRGQLLAYL